MSQEYFKENLAVTKAEIDKKIAEENLMLENIVDEGKRKKAEWDLQSASLKMDKIPKATEMNQPQAAQIGEQKIKYSQQIIDEYISRITAPSVAEQSPSTQPDYPDEYKPRSR